MPHLHIKTLKHFRKKKLTHYTCSASKWTLCTTHVSWDCLQPPGYTDKVLWKMDGWISFKKWGLSVSQTEISTSVESACTKPSIFQHFIPKNMVKILFVGVTERDPKHPKHLARICQQNKTFFELGFIPCSDFTVDIYYLGKLHGEVRFS